MWYPPPTDLIAQKAAVRAQFQNAIKLLAASAKNHAKTSSAELKDISSWTAQDVASGELSTEQLMHLAKLRFTGNSSSSSGSNNNNPDKSDASSSQQYQEGEKGQDKNKDKSSGGKDPELAVQAWIQASRQGNTDASYSVAFCLLNGIGIEQDDEEAFQLMFPLANSYNNAHAHVSEGWLNGLSDVLIFL